MVMTLLWWKQHGTTVRLCGIFIGLAEVKKYSREQHVVDLLVYVVYEVDWGCPISVSTSN